MIAYADGPQAYQGAERPLLAADERGFGKLGTARVSGSLSLASAKSNAEIL
jgi:hypothetical protein